MAENFYTILTAVGKAKLANSAVLGSKVNFKTLKVGDGKGAYYEPSENQTSLVNEVWEGDISSITVDTDNSNWIVTQTVIPATVGGFSIREAGIFDEDGDLIAISKLSETYKPVVSEGSIKDLCIKIVLEVSNVQSVTLKIDPTIIVATKEDIDKLKTEHDDDVTNLEAEIQQVKADVYQQQKTYAELKTLFTNNQLVPGTQYVLSDYKTKYQQPTTLVIKEMSVERLVLTAISTNKFAPVCSSLDYPKDVIYYDFDLNLCEDGTTSRNGFILRRVNEEPNVMIDAPLDWRTMLWARYKPNATQYLVGSTLTNYSTWTSGVATLGVIYKAGNKLLMAWNNTTIPTSATDSNVFVTIYDDITIGMLTSPTANLKVGADVSNANGLYLVPSTLHERPTFGANCNRIKIPVRYFDKYWGDNKPYFPDNVFGDNCLCITCGENFCVNTISSGCTYMSFGSNCNSNVIMGSCGSLTFGSYCVGNFIGGSSGGNTFGSNCNNNVIGGSFNANNLGSNSWGNVFGSNCTANVLGTNCYQNIFSSGCSNNSLGASCSSNNFGYNCINNKLDGACYSCTFGSGCSNNVLESGCCLNVFGASCIGNHMSSYSPNNTFGSGCVYNFLSSNVHHNTFGANCNANTLGATSQYNTFGNNKGLLNIKVLKGKDLSALTTLENRGYITNIESRSDGYYVYWSINSSNVPVYAVIA